MSDPEEKGKKDKAAEIQSILADLQTIFSGESPTREESKPDIIIETTPETKAAPVIPVEEPRQTPPPSIEAAPPLPTGTQVEHNPIEEVLAPWAGTPAPEMPLPQPEIKPQAQVPAEAGTPISGLQEIEPGSIPVAYFYPQGLDNAVRICSENLAEIAKKVARKPVILGKRLVRSYVPGAPIAPSDIVNEAHAASCLIVVLLGSGLSDDQIVAYRVTCDASGIMFRFADVSEVDKRSLYIDMVVDFVLLQK